MLPNKLQMNEDKTEVLLVTPKRVKYLLICKEDEIDSTFWKFTQQLLCATQSGDAFLELRRINSLRNFLNTFSVKTRVCSLVLSRIEYCNSLLAGLPQCLLKKIQYVQNRL